ncbi:uncharacterized protein LOC128179420 [Crassostrea angulata]|uniref:uncharacterized protein LOC128179420 n=1 Tax=Magallana angulata TaxID=2784310 RepID=UPI0022B1BC8D|nr:uncharacterized protein LOC128179420 [Crassostrea angulata]
METASFRCYSYNNSTLNFRAILRGLQRKSLKFKQISLITFQQYLASRTPYISDWSLYTPEPCLRIIRHCTDCDSPNDIVDLHRDYNIIKTIHEIIGSVLQEEKSFLPFSEQVQSLKFLHRSIKQLLCELHTFLLVLGLHDVIHGFVGDVINSPDWCVFESVSTRYERDVYLLRQVTAVSSEIYHRYSMLIP